MCEIARDWSGVRGSASSGSGQFFYLFALSFLVTAAAAGLAIWTYWRLT